MNQISRLPLVCGTHVLADFHGAKNLFDAEPATDVFRRAAEVAGATVLDVSMHDFGARAGFTGVATLAESHISVHTWPEHGYAAIDIFMCGTCEPMVALDHLRRFFRPRREDVNRIERGIMADIAVPG